VLVAVGKTDRSGRCRSWLMCLRHRLSVGRLGASGPRARRRRFGRPTGGFGPNVTHWADLPKPLSRRPPSNSGALDSLIEMPVPTTMLQSGRWAEPIPHSRIDADAVVCPR
jgi:hypothetical protein